MTGAPDGKDRPLSRTADAGVALPSATPLRALIEGYKHFRSAEYEPNRDEYLRLARRGQQPKVMAIGCCDSRVHPMAVTEAHAGEMFIVRNVANLVPPYEPGARRQGTSAALEFAVCHLGVEHIIVFGHSRCGGVRALIEGEVGRMRDVEFVLPWMQIVGGLRGQVEAAQPGLEGDALLRACERHAVLTSLRNLEDFPFIARRKLEGRLMTHGWYFDIDSGELSAYEPAQGRWGPVEAVFAAALP